MDASLVPTETGTNEAQTLSYILSPVNCSPLSPHSFNNLETNSEPINLVQNLPPNFNSKDISVSVSHMKENNERKNIESTIENCNITQKKTISSSTFACCHSKSIGMKNQKSQMTSIMTNTGTRSDDHCINLKNAQCFRSASSPQLTFKPLTRSKVYRKASLKYSTNKSSLQSDLSTFTIDNFNVVSNIQTKNTANNNKCILSKANKYKKLPEKCPIQVDETQNEKFKENDSSISNTKNKWNRKDVHITCNPLSTQYPYSSTPCQKTASGTVTETQDEEPKSRSCGSFLPILSLIPQTVIGFQYLSPKMKFSWWRNKIS